MKKEIPELKAAGDVSFKIGKANLHGDMFDEVFEMDANLGFLLPLSSTTDEDDASDVRS